MQMPPPKLLSVHRKSGRLLQLTSAASSVVLQSPCGISSFKPATTVGSLMLAARLMKSNMKLKITSEWGRDSNGFNERRGMRHPFGSTRKNENASAGISPRISGTTARKSAGYVFMEISGYLAGICANFWYAVASRSTRNAVILTLRPRSFQDAFARRNAFNAIPNEVSSNRSFALCQGPAKPST